MEKVYYLILKPEKRVVERIIFNGDKAYDFYVGQNKLDHDYVSQHITLRERIHIDTKNEVFDEMMKAISSISNLPQDKENYVLIESKNQVGKYYNRVYRPSMEEPRAEYFQKVFKSPDYEVRELQEKVFKKKAYFPIDELGLLSSLNQLSILTNSLYSLFQTIHPDKSCLGVYGHSVRNLLILACTEAETQLKGILLNNGYAKKTSLSTKDYVKLKDILALEQYKVKLDHYPLLDELKPFSMWNAEKPTESLSWYFNYNATKHDRESKMNCGSIVNVINAVAAVAILIRAQYGEQDLYWKEHIRGFFRFTEIPSWTIEQKYIPPIKGEDWMSVNYFSQAYNLLI